MTQLYRLILARNDGSEFESVYTEMNPLSLEEVLQAIDQYCYRNWDWRLVEA